MELLRRTPSGGPTPAGTPPRDRPKFRVFSLLCRNCCSFFSLWEVFSWKCGRGSRPRSTQSARLGSLGSLTIRGTHTSWPPPFVAPTFRGLQNSGLRLLHAAPEQRRRSCARIERVHKGQKPERRRVSILERSQNSCTARFGDTSGIPGASKKLPSAPGHFSGPLGFPGGQRKTTPALLAFSGPPGVPEVPERIPENAQKCQGVREKDHRVPENAEPHSASEKTKSTFFRLLADCPSLMCCACVNCTVCVRHVSFHRSDVGQMDSSSAKCPSWGERSKILAITYTCL